MRINLTNEWQKLPYSSGTIDNYSSLITVEISSDKTDGILLRPHDRFSYDDVPAMYIRSCSKPTSIGLVPFGEATYTANAEQIGQEVSVAEEGNAATANDIDSLFN